MNTSLNTSPSLPPLLIPDAISISKRTYQKIKQNLFWAFIYNIIGIPLAALGFLGPAIAGAAMAFSGVSVVGNALLLKRWKPQSRMNGQTPSSIGKHDIFSDPFDFQNNDSSN